MENIHFYETSITWKNGRIGEISSPEFKNIEVATPPEFKGGVPGIWSPEHLFVASANICLMTTFLAIAENSKLEFKSYSAKAIGKLEKVEGKFMISEIELFPRVVVSEGADRERVHRIVEKAEANCLISNSMKSSIKLNVEVVTE